MWLRSGWWGNFSLKYFYWFSILWDFFYFLLLLLYVQVLLHKTAGNASVWVWQWDKSILMGVLAPKRSMSRKRRHQTRSGEVDLVPRCLCLSGQQPSPTPSETRYTSTWNGISSLSLPNQTLSTVHWLSALFKFWLHLKSSAWLGWLVG